LGKVAENFKKSIAALHFHMLLSHHPMQPLAPTHRRSCSDKRSTFAPMTTPAAPRHLSPKEAAQQLGLSTRTVLKRVAEGRISPVFRINTRVIRIPQEAVDRYLADCTDGPPRARDRAV
jgi:excisionase family DNA binding protein